jgi:hypothetical protein
MDNFVDSQITDRFKSGRQDVHDLIAPLVKLASESSSLVVGYEAHKWVFRRGDSYFSRLRHAC